MACFGTAMLLTRGGARLMGVVPVRRGATRVSAARNGSVYQYGELLGHHVLRGNSYSCCGSTSTSTSGRGVARAFSTLNATELENKAKAKAKGKAAAVTVASVPLSQYCANVPRSSTGNWWYW